MNEALIISNLLLWIVVIALAALVLALMRQIGVLHERIAPAGALLDRQGAGVGDPAPELEVRDRRGAAVRIGGVDPSDAATLLLFVSPSCPVCETILPVARSVRHAEGPRLRLVLASDGDGDDAEHARFIAAHALEEETYVAARELGMAFRVGQVPHAVLIDAQGIVRARGLVNSREHLESLFEARDRGVASLQDYVRARAERDVA